MSESPPTPESQPAAPLPCRGSDHLELLVDEVDRLARLLDGVLRGSDPAAIAARRAVETDATVEATLRLDGALRTTAEGGTERAGTWLDALGDTATADRPGPDDEAYDGAHDGPDVVDDAELGRLAGLERAGASAAIASGDLADAFGRASADGAGLGMALATLHGRLTTGLVAPDRVGRLRRGPRVVHDASVGRVLYFPTDRDLLPDAWDALLRHVTGSGAGGAAARLPAAVRAALLHLELVRHQPFDAANGRLARAAAGLALLADGLLPSGLGAPDTVLAEDTLGYHEEVAASVRRRDATRWVERMLEAQGTALRRSIDAIGDTGIGADGDTDGRTDSSRAGVAPLPAELADAFTLGDVADLLGLTVTSARAQCSAWVVAGRIRRVLGSAGLRLVRTEDQSPTV